MNITVNEKTICSVFNDSQSKKEIVDFLNEIIDNEIEKENPDCDLIDECINALDKFQSGDSTQPLLHLLLTKKQVLKYCKSRSKNNNALKAVIAAGLVLIMSGATVFTASPALAQNVKSFFETVISTMLDLSDDTENETPDNIGSIYASYSGAEKVKSPDDIKIDKIKVFAVSHDNSEQEIPVSKCKVKKVVNRTESKSFVIVAVSYNGCACSIAIELEE